MAERYTKIYSLPENLYAENAPVVILAGALLKDNQTGKMLIQLKLQNIDKRTISSMRLRFLLLDNDGCQIGNPFYHEYDSLSFTENDYFGQRFRNFLYRYV